MTKYWCTDIQYLSLYIYIYIHIRRFFLFLYLTGPGPQRHFNANHRVHKKNVAGEHGYKGGLNEDYLFSPRTGFIKIEAYTKPNDA
jgi:hypothetical protein